MKRILAALLAALTICSTFAACSDKAADADASDTSQALSTVEETTIPEEKLEIEVTDYGGTTINIALTGNWEFTDFIAEEMTGEPVNDARYSQMAAVAELLNVDFDVVNKSGSASGGQGTGYQLIDKMILAGTNDYDIADIGCYDVSTLAYNGKLLDLNAIQNIDLTKSWWDQKAYEQLAVKGKMFYTTGDACVLDNDCTYCILFNKQVLANYNLSDPYALVNDGKWVYDTFLEMADSVDSDLNGNGKHDAEDEFGVLVWQDSIIGMLHGTGGRFATIGEDGVIELTLNSERNFDVLTSWLTAKTQPLVWFLEAGTDEISHASFTGNRCLFYTRYIKAVSWFRDMETDFGILPYPKWDEAQESYCNTMHAYGTSYLCMPIVIEDAEMSGAVLEALSYYGKELITPMYYEKTLKGKYFRDEESSAMLDLIFATRFFDIGTYYQLGGYNEKVITMMQQGDTNFTSMYEKNLAAAEKKLDQINEAYAEMLNG